LGHGLGQTRLLLTASLVNRLGVDMLDVLPLGMRREETLHLRRLRGRGAEPRLPAWAGSAGFERHEVDANPVTADELQAVSCLRVFPRARLSLLPCLPRLIEAGDHRRRADQTPDDGGQKSSQR